MGDDLLESRDRVRGSLEGESNMRPANFSEEAEPVNAGNGAVAQPVGEEEGQDENSTDSSPGGNGRLDDRDPFCVIIEGKCESPCIWVNPREIAFAEGMAKRGFFRVGNPYGPTVDDGASGESYTKGEVQAPCGPDRVVPACEGVNYMLTAHIQFLSWEDAHSDPAFGTKFGPSVDFRCAEMLNGASARAVAMKPDCPAGCPVPEVGEPNWKQVFIGRITSKNNLKTYMNLWKRDLDGAAERVSEGGDSPEGEEWDRDVGVIEMIPSPSEEPYTVPGARKQLTTGYYIVALVQVPVMCGVSKVPTGNTPTPVGNRESGRKRPRFGDKEPVPPGPKEFRTWCTPGKFDRSPDGSLRCCSVADENKCHNYGCHEPGTSCVRTSEEKCECLPTDGDDAVLLGGAGMASSLEIGGSRMSSAGHRPGLGSVCRQLGVMVIRPGRPRTIEEVRRPGHEGNQVSAGSGNRGFALPELGVGGIGVAEATSIKGAMAMRVTAISPVDGGVPAVETTGMRRE